MKLSEAIILGSTMIRHRPYAGSSSGPEGCAIQCAMAATGKQGTTQCGNLFPWFYAHKEVNCPSCGDLLTSVSRVVAFHLNDEHKWPIDKIAEWVARYEPKETEPTSTIDPLAHDLDSALTCAKVSL